MRLETAAARFDSQLSLIDDNVMESNAHDMAIFTNLQFTTPQE